MLDKDFDVKDFLRNLPPGSVLIFGNCSDDRTPDENYRIYRELKTAAPNAHIKIICIPGAMHGLMDTSDKFDEERMFLDKKIRLLTDGATAVAVVASVHELCLDYAPILSREELNSLQEEEVDNLPGALDFILGEKFLGLIVLKTLLNEAGKEVDVTQLLGGMSTRGNQE